MNGLSISYSPANLDRDTLALYGRYDGAFFGNVTDSAITAGIKYSW